MARSSPRRRSFSPLPTAPAPTASALLFSNAFSALFSDEEDVEFADSGSSDEEDSDAGAEIPPEEVSSLHGLCSQLILMFSLKVASHLTRKTDPPRSVKKRRRSPSRRPAAQAAADKNTLEITGKPKRRRKKARTNEPSLTLPGPMPGPITVPLPASSLAPPSTDAPGPSSSHVPLAANAPTIPAAESAEPKVCMLVIPELYRSLIVSQKQPKNAIYLFYTPVAQNPTRPRDRALSSDKHYRCNYSKVDGFEGKCFTITAAMKGNTNGLYSTCHRFFACLLTSLVYRSCVASRNAIPGAF